MLTTSQIEEILRGALPDELHLHVAGIAQIIYATAAGTVSIEDAQTHLSTVPAFRRILETLTEAQGTPGAALTFGEHSQVGDVDIKEFSAGSILKLTINNYFGGAMEPGRIAEEGEDALPAPGQAPYKGLFFYDESDADLFFGREALVAQLVARLRNEPFLAVIGASGSGKSSLLRAGLVPALKHKATGDEDGLPLASPYVFIRVITPTARPLESLAVCLTQDSESVTATATLIDDLAKDTRGFYLAGRRLLSRSRLPEGTQPSLLVLVVDQFEEVFTLCTSKSEREAFIANLLAASDPEATRSIIVVLALRADFYDECGQFARLRTMLEQSQAYIGPMTRSEIIEAIEGPARHGGWELEPGLVEVIVTELGDEPGILPLLSHALHETWKRREGRRLTLRGYIAAGGVRRAITTTADRVYYKQLDPEQQNIARTIFLRLARLSEGTHATRRRASLGELATVTEQGQALNRVLGLLTDARLITVDQNSAEVAHEALIREWALLRSWLDEDRVGFQLKLKLADDALEWLRLKEDESLLYRGVRLATLEEWVTVHPGSLTPDEQAFLNAGRVLRQREEAAHEQQRRIELEQARRIAQEAEARAVAERRSSRLTRLLLGISLIFSAGLAVLLIWLYGQTAAFWLRQRAIAGSDLVALPGGTFPTGLGDTTRVGPFYMERTEVANWQYDLCVRAGYCQPLAFMEEHRGPAVANLPVVGVTALQAATYCDWVGRRLPFATEWERAARGAQGQPWPWGFGPPVPERANFATNDGPSPLQAVGSHPAGATPEGIYDLAGNAWEWTASARYDCVGGDGYCIGPWNRLDNTSTTLLVRGGGSDSPPMDSITSTFLAPTEVSREFIGFRCVR